jgi:hypothetical protein
LTDVNPRSWDRALGARDLNPSDQFFAVELLALAIALNQEGHGVQHALIGAEPPPARQTLTPPPDAALLVTRGIYHPRLVARITVGTIHTQKSLSYQTLTNINYNSNINRPNHQLLLGK